MFLVVVTFGEQLKPEVLERDRTYVTFPQRRLTEIAGRLGVPLLDLFDLDPDADIGPDAIHLTARGRGIVAERISGFLIERELVPAVRLVPEEG